MNEDQYGIENETPAVEDPLAAARGIIIGAFFGGIAWGVLIFAVLRWYR